LKHSHLDVTGLCDFFPPEAFGGSRQNDLVRKNLHLNKQVSGILINCVRAMLV
jgi:hypothetical protein